MNYKKSLGQNFLKNKNIAERIAETANIKKNDVILEVGPGQGVLTNFLLQKSEHVIAVEKDKNLVDFLMDKFKDNRNLKIVHDDILKFKPKSYKLKAKSYKIVANIPYYITSRFLRQFLESEYQPSLMILMVQKEVAERIIAKDRKESLLSISVKAYGKPKIIIRVPAGNFVPKPKVDSAVIQIENISKDFFRKSCFHLEAGLPSEIDEKNFFQLLKQGFGHKRKMLKNNLQHFVQHSVLNMLEKCKIPPLARAEELSLENWKCLYQTINPNEDRPR